MSLMEEYQPFRVPGTAADIVNIDADHVDGQNVIYWEDIEQVFPGIQYVRNGNSVVKLLRGSDGRRIEPHRIKHYPGAVLDAVLAVAREHVQVHSPMATLSLAQTDGLPDGPTNGTTENKAIEALQITPVLTNTPVSDKPGFECTVINKLDGLYNQGDKTQQIALQIFELEKQMNDRLTLIQSKTEAILTQNYELLEYIIPRLFVVLPETSTTWDPRTMFSTNKIPHNLHLANHEGYIVNKPTEFLKKYGPFLMVILEMIKAGTIIAGHIVPVVANLNVTGALDSAQSTIDSISSKVFEGAKYSLAYLEETRTLIEKSDDVSVDGNATLSQQDLANYLDGVEALEGVDLRELGSYLAVNSSDNLLGNLFRMTTKEGHVKWVCRDHHRAGYQEAHIQNLREVVKLAGGSFDEISGTVTIVLGSSITAVQFYDAVSKAKGVLDLDVSLNWNQEYTDLVKLKDMILKSNINSVRVNLCGFEGPTIDINLSGSRRYDPIFQIMGLPSVRSFSIANVPRNFFQQSKLLSKKVNFSNLTHLRIDKIYQRPISPNKVMSTINMVRTFEVQQLMDMYDRMNGMTINFSDADIIKLKLLVAHAPNLSNLYLDLQLQHFVSIFNSFQRHRTYPIVASGGMRILPPRSDSLQSKAALQNVAELFQVHGARLEVWDAKMVPVEEASVEALAEATRDGSSLRDLSFVVNEESVQHFARIVARSELHVLQIRLNSSQVSMRILESIQWQHIRQLWIEEHDDCLALKGLVEGIQKSVSLEHLHYENSYMSKAEVQTLLDALQHATQLQTIALPYTDTTEEQKQQIGARGIKLKIITTARRDYERQWRGKLEAATEKQSAQLEARSTCAFVS
ncbi:hypothetical protein BGX26_010707 [Mortierella sp. AD094]|nr:hypothetical protein BGX26_010707 [Mortierella sp. AD094]